MELPNNATTLKGYFVTVPNAEGQEISYRRSPIMDLLHDQLPGSIDKFKILIKHGMDINFRDPAGVHENTPYTNILTHENRADLLDYLHDCIINGSAQIGELENMTSSTSLAIAIRTFKLSRHTPEDKTALSQHAALHEGDVDSAKAMLKKYLTVE